MASPFQRNKKERRRWRKAAKSVVGNVAQLEKINPEIAASVRRMAEIYTKIAGSKRGKRPREARPTFNGLGFDLHSLVTYRRRLA